MYRLKAMLVLLFGRQMVSYSCGGMKFETYGWRGRVLAFEFQSWGKQRTSDIASWANVPLNDKLHPPQFPHPLEDASA
jgi:hypothetical protein